MANEYRNGYYNGSAAVDLYRDSRGTAAPQIDHPGLPEEQQLPERVRHVQVKTAIAPFAMLGMVLVACMLILVVFGYVQLYEASERVAALESRLSGLQSENAILESLYEGSIDLKSIEAKAQELGLSQPSASQVRYLNLSGSDRAEIFEVEKTNLFKQIIQAIEASAGGLVEYLS